MVDNDRGDNYPKGLVLRISKGVFLGILAYLPLFFISKVLQPLESFLPWYGSSAKIFTIIWIVFLIGGIFTSGTIYQYILGVTRTVATMAFFIYVLNGGFVPLILPIEGADISIIIDLRVILAMLVLVCLLGISRQVVQAVAFVSRQAEVDEE